MGPLAPGSRVVGERGTYIVGSKRKEGGMGYIHWGHEERRPNQRVVLKTAKEEGTDMDRIVKQKLVDEGDILWAVNHPNIVRYVDRRPASEFVLLLECLEGQSLRSAFTGKPAPEEETRIYADIMLDTLKYLHSRNIIYRDLKPENIINEPGRRLVLLDFGAAKQGYLHTYGPGTLVGSPGWSAPEQFSTGEVTEASDIYAFGTTLFFLLTGKEPRQFMRHDGALLKGPRDVNPSVSRELSEVVSGAVQSDPRLRPQTADDVWNLLRGTYARLGVPNIVAGGRRYEVRTVLEIGRDHDCTKSLCPVRHQLDVSVNDPSRYVGRIHARIVNRSGRCWLQDIGAKNRLAVSRRGQGWHQIREGSEYALEDKDIIALVYADGRGPHITFTFDAS